MMPKVSRVYRKWGPKSDVNLVGSDTLRLGTEIIEIWPPYCVRYFHCL